MEEREIGRKGGREEDTETGRREEGEGEGETEGDGGE